MTGKCICGHYLNDHARNPVMELKATSNLTRALFENRLNCKHCDCTEFRKNNRWERFWNGSETGKKNYSNSHMDN